MARFSARFAEHRVLEQELERLEELFNDNQERLARIEMSNREQFPLLEVVDRAPLPLEPVRALYARDAGIALAPSALAALFLAWLLDYLTGRMRRGPAVTGVRISFGAAPEGPLLPGHGFDPLLVGGAAAPQFPSAWPRELEQGGVAALLEATTPVTALSTRHLSRYERLSPPGANRPLEEIELFYPTLVA